MAMRHLQGRRIVGFHFCLALGSEHVTDMPNACVWSPTPLNTAIVTFMFIATAIVINIIVDIHDDHHNHTCGGLR